MSAERPQQPIRSRAPKKYLIRWSLRLGRQELERMVGRPEALEKGLNFVRRLAKENKLELYRILPMEELTKFAPARGAALESANPNGIAIAKAASLEEARKMVESWAESFGYSGVSVQNYLEYEISPLLDITRGGE